MLPNSGHASGGGQWHYRRPVSCCPITALSQPAGYAPVSSRIRVCPCLCCLPYLLAHFILYRRFLLSCVNVSHISSASATAHLEFVISLSLYLISFCVSSLCCRTRIPMYCHVVYLVHPFHYLRLFSVYLAFSSLASHCGYILFLSVVLLSRCGGILRLVSVCLFSANEIPVTDIEYQTK